MKNNTSAIQTYKKDKAVVRVITQFLKVSSNNIISANYCFLRHITLLYSYLNQEIMYQIFFYSSSLYSTSSWIKQSQKVNVFCISSVLDCCPKELQSKALPNKFLSETERFIMSMLNLAQLSLTVMEQRAHMSHLYPRKILNTTFSE